MGSSLLSLSLPCLLLGDFFDLFYPMKSVEGVEMTCADWFCCSARKAESPEDVHRDLLGRRK